MMEEKKDALVKETVSRMEAAPAALPAAPAVPTFVKIGTAEIFAPLPPKRWVCEGLGWAPGRPAMLAGYGYSGKTLAAQCAALQLAAGVTLWQPRPGAGSSPFRVEGAKRVLHLDYEVGADDTRRRYQRLARGAGLTPEHLEGRLVLSCFPGIGLNDRRLCPVPGGAARSMAEEVFLRECTGFDLVFIDAFRGTIPGQDENESRVRDYLDILTRVSEATGAAFVVLHHAGKSKQEDGRMVLRGSSAIFDACGSVHAMAGEATKGANLPKMVEQTKNSAAARGAAGEPFGLSISDVMIDNDRFGGLAVEYRTQEAAAAVIKAAQANAANGSEDATAARRSKSPLEGRV